MFKPLPLYIGLRYIGAKHRTHFFSFVSLVSLLGLTLGVAALVLVLSVMNGFERELQDRILGSIPQVLVEQSQGIHNWSALAKRLQHEQSDIQAIAPLTRSDALLSFSGQVAGAQIFGVDPIYENQVSHIAHFIQDTELKKLISGHYQIILGVGLATQLNVNSGDSLLVVLPQLRMTPFGAFPRYRRFKVIGTFTTNAEPDNYLALVHQEDAARLIGQAPDTVKGLRLVYSDVFSAPEAASRLQAVLGADYQVSNWSQTQGQFFKAVKMERIIVALLLSIIIAVAGFNVLSGLVMLVTEKSADIAILQTLGLSTWDIRKIFMFQGLCLGVGGTLVGIILGVLGALSITSIVAWLQQISHSQWFAAYYLDYLPSEIKVSDIFIIFSVAVLLSFLGTLYPASRAAKVQPAEVLRYE